MAATLAVTNPTSRRPGASAERAGAAAPDLDAFLASVERRAFVAARLALRDDDAALDVVQDAMLRVVERYADRDPKTWAPLFFRILFNRIEDHRRRRGLARLLRWRGPAAGEGEPEAEAVDLLTSEARRPDEACEDGRLRAALREAVARLPERQRQVFLLRQWQGMSVEETATTLGLSGGSVKTHLSRAMTSMRDRLGELSDHETR